MKEGGYSPYFGYILDGKMVSTAEYHEHQLRKDNHIDKAIDRGLIIWS